MIPLNKFWQGVWHGTQWAACAVFFMTLFIHWNNYDSSIEAFYPLSVYYVCSIAQMIFSMAILTWAPREEVKDV